MAILRSFGVHFVMDINDGACGGVHGPQTGWAVTAKGARSLIGEVAPAMDGGSQFYGDDPNDASSKVIRDMMRKRRSCDFCYTKKRKCDGDGVNPCRYSTG